jgi:carbon-monoxide dehydrogenase small subunit
MRVSLTINGKRLEMDATPNDRLADTLRTNGCPSVKIGCGDGACGTCTVLLDGKPSLSCEYLTVRADGAEIMTVEGLGDEAEKIVDCLIRAGAEGCGYCAPGFVVLAYALKREYPNANYEQARMYLNGNLCRCTGYTVRVEAALEYLKMT